MKVIHDSLWLPDCDCKPFLSCFWPCMYWKIERDRYLNPNVQKVFASIFMLIVKICYIYRSEVKAKLIMNSLKQFYYNKNICIKQVYSKYFFLNSFMIKCINPLAYNKFGGFKEVGTKLWNPPNLFHATVKYEASDKSLTNRQSLLIKDTEWLILTKNIQVKPNIWSK